MREAGDQAHAIQGNAQSSIKGDGTPVSEADTLANDILVSALQNAFPNDSILSEELDDDLSRLQAQRLWIIDPIDGTSAFLEGRDEWAVQVALAIDNTLVLGALYLPTKKRFYIGIVGAVNGLDVSEARLYNDDNSFDVCRVPENPPACILLSRSNRNKNAMIHIQKILHEYSVLTISSIGAKVDALIQGQGCFHLNPARIAEWDYAAPAAVLFAAGGHCCDQHNKPLPINSESAVCDGLIFSTTPGHQKIMSRLRDTEKK